MLNDKKPKVVNVLCLYFVFKAELMKVPNHPITRMEKFFHIPEGLDANKSLYDEVKYTNYPTDELGMELYF